jgi:hypothetical protein
MRYLNFSASKPNQVSVPLTSVLEHTLKNLTSRIANTTQREKLSTGQNEKDNHNDKFRLNMSLEPDGHVIFALFNCNNTIRVGFQIKRIKP